MRSISAGRYEVTSRPTSCSRTEGFIQVFMVNSSLEFMIQRVATRLVMEVI
jgi:hypothetical protein